MVAVSRFAEFSVTGQTFATGTTTEALTGEGTRGYSRGTGLGAGDDSFTIVLGSNDTLNLNINGVAGTITLASGTDLDPRFVARDIGYKLHSHSNATSNDSWKFAQCEWRNGGSAAATGNSFIIYSGVLGAGGGSNDVNVTGGTAQATLGFGSVTEVVGTADTVNASYTGTVVVSGSYSGQFDDFYTVMIADDETVKSVTPGGGNVYSGTVTVGGIYTGASDNTYSITIDTTNGTTMGGGSNQVPIMDFTDTGTEDSSSDPVELLYPNHWYDLGVNGARIRFTDAAFGPSDTFTVVASGATGGGGASGAAKYIFTSNQDDSTKTHGISALTTSTAQSQVGTRGVTMSWSNSGTLTARDRFHIICRGPQPTNSNVTQLNFGNVTVSTQSPVKVVWFELISGAVAMSTVKFSLQSDGTFQHHDQGNSDTEFHFGTCGAGSDAPGSGATANNQLEFPVDSSGLGRILATDIDSDTPPIYLFATKADLAEVASADSAETIGNYLGGLVSDFIWLAIKLGANETGANSTINYRMYFDFS